MMNEEQEAVVFQALGKASMCWSEIPSGTFDSKQAKWIGISLIKFLDDGTIPSWYQP